MDQNCNFDENSSCRISGNCNCSIILSSRNSVASFLRFVNSSSLSFAEIISKYNIVKSKVIPSRRDKLLRIKKLDLFIQVMRVKAIFCK